MKKWIEIAVVVIVVVLVAITLDKAGMLEFLNFTKKK